MSDQLKAADVERAVRNSIPFVLRFEGSVPDSFPLLENALETFLVELGQERLQEVLSYCVKELALNAEKANVKRIYFDERSLDLSRRDDYERGMRGFPEEMSHNLEHYLAKLAERRMAVDVTFRATEEDLILSVGNDAALVPLELERIRDRIARARTFHSFTDALESSVDRSEGAGLGIMILLQFLTSIGLDEKAFSVKAEGGRTVASIVIPVADTQADRARILAETIARSIESLPHFPESVVTLVKLTEDASASVNEISRSISRDPALTAELLKHVNSAYYGLPSRVNGIAQAVTLIGLRSLHQLLYSFGFHIILQKHHAQMKALWDHSLRAAFYSFIVARDCRRAPDILDDVYVAGILHDLGYIAMRSLPPATREKIRRFCSERNIPLSLFEIFSDGMKHAELGALIGEKWNFPDQLVEGIRYHHDPLRAGSRHRGVVFCVYLGNAVCDLERGMLTFAQLDQSVLRDCGIQTEVQFSQVALKLRTLYEEASGELPRH
ncbi:MAG TPA: HDOD domain-containing protein [Spirochaetia bacterium]|nr:HDOD domain-containing protein [Spirochaetia bacterium]